MEINLNDQHKNIFGLLNSLKEKDYNLSINSRLVIDISNICATIKTNTTIINDLKSNKLAEEKAENKINLDQINGESNSILNLERSKIIDNKKSMNIEKSYLSKRRIEPTPCNTITSPDSYIDLFKEDKYLNDSKIESLNVTASELMSFDSVFFSKEIFKIKSKLNDELSEKEIMSLLKVMSSELLVILFKSFSKLRSKSKENKNSNDNLINNFKQLILDIGVSNSDLYDNCIRRVLYIKESFKFINFIKSVNFIIDQKNHASLLKYKLCLKLAKVSESDSFTKENLDIFLELLESKNINNKDLKKAIKNKFLGKYTDKFPNSKELDFNKMSMILELFLKN